MLEGPAGKLAIALALPEDMRDPYAVWDSKTTSNILTELASRYPDNYGQIIDKLSEIARVGATYSGGFSFGLSDLLPTNAYKEYVKELESQIKRVVQDKFTDKQDEELAKKISSLNDAYFKKVEAELESAGNPVYVLAKTKIRGNPTTIRRIAHAESAYLDFWGRLIPYPILHNFSVGLEPAEYWASSYGSKEGIVTTKLAPGQAGYIYKQLAQTAHRLIVTKFNGPEAGDIRGAPVSTEDDQIVGTFLALPAGGFQKGTLITQEVLQKLRSRGIDEVLIHSPIAGGPADGIYGIQVGAHGGVPAPGTLVGIEAAQALGERISQSSVGKKHQGTVKGGVGSISKTVDMIINTPKNFVGGAAHATVEGKITKIESAPAGGNYVYVNNVPHYVSPGKGVLKKIGDFVEAGDVLSEGLPNPELITKYKGIGEGRRYFARQLLDVFRGGGLAVHRRNTEIIARALINYVKFDKNFKEYTEGDIVKYDQLEHSWVPRPGSVFLDVSQARNMYLERPVLHYTIGTKITQSVIEKLRKYNINKVVVNKEPPPFSMEMLSARDVILFDQDWLSRLFGAYQKRTLLEAAAYGGVSEKYKTTSFVPSLAEGIYFGKKWPKEIIESSR